MPRDQGSIGLIEDDPIMGGSMLQRLEIEGYRVEWWKTGGDALRALEADPALLDLVVCDIRLPDISGEEVFHILAESSASPPFLFVTGYGEIDQAVRLMRCGAVDFMTKPFRMEDFLERIRTNQRPRSPLADAVGELGQSAVMLEVENVLRRYAERGSPILITGETGTGKEIAARFVHRISAKAGSPFIAVNCAAIPAELLESEIFGHEKGAFTGAAKRHRGYAERAARGTLFLDEIGDMPTPLQAKMLRLIESGRFTPLGSEEEIRFSGRIVSATHRDLASEAREGRFREDLYYRLAVLPVSMPPLRERPGDVPWLTEMLLDEVLAGNDERLRGLSPAAEEALLDYAWPGNIRELRNRIERAAAMAAGDWIMPHDLFPENHGVLQPPTFAALADVREAAETRQIERALRQSNGKLVAAAKLLGISRTTLWEKMSRLGIAAERSES